MKIELEIPELPESISKTHRVVSQSERNSLELEHTDFILNCGAKEWTKVHQYNIGCTWRQKEYILAVARLHIERSNPEGVILTDEIKKKYPNVRFLSVEEHERLVKLGGLIYGDLFLFDTFDTESNFNILLENGIGNHIGWTFATTRPEGYYLTAKCYEKEKPAKEVLTTIKYIPHTAKTCPKFGVLKSKKHDDAWAQFGVTPDGVHLVLSKRSKIDTTSSVYETPVQGIFYTFEAALKDLEYFSEDEWVPFGQKVIV